MEKQSKNKTHVTSKLFIAVAFQPLGINYVMDHTGIRRTVGFLPEIRFSALHISSHTEYTLNKSSIASDKENPSTSKSHQGGKCLHTMPSIGSSQTRRKHVVLHPLDKFTGVT